VGERSSIGPVIALVAGLFIYQWWVTPSLDVEESVRGFAHDTGAVFIEAAERIDRGEIKSDADLRKFIHDAREKAAADNFRWVADILTDATTDKWEGDTRADACREIGHKLGE